MDNELIVYKELTEVATSLSKSSLIPETFKKPEDALYAIAQGRELGLSPIYSLNNISIIKGRSFLSADAMLAIAKKSPEYGGSTIEETADACTVTMTRNYANGVSDTRKVTFTIQDASKAGLVKEGSGWVKYRSRMLKARAQSYCVKDLFGDLLAGIYSTEEADEIPAPQPATPKGKRQTVKPEYEVVEEKVEPTMIEIANLAKAANDTLNSFGMLHSRRMQYQERITEAAKNRDAEALAQITSELHAEKDKAEDAAKPQAKPIPQEIAISEEPEPSTDEAAALLIIKDSIAKQMNTLLSLGYETKHVVNSLNKQLGTAILLDKASEWHTQLAVADFSIEKGNAGIEYWRGVIADKIKKGKLPEQKAEPADNEIAELIGKIDFLITEKNIDLDQPEWAEAKTLIQKGDYTSVKAALALLDF